jgi:phosphatidylglycerol:prolipoprotein diacylglycerol transferase
MLDVLAFAAPLAGAIGRIGCTLAHDHRGLPSQGSLAFHFPEGGRYDLGFFDLLFLGALSILFAALGRKPKFPLFFVGLSGSAYGAFRIWRDTMDVASSFTAWATVCMIGVAALMFGATMEARAKHDTRGTGRSASGPAMASDSSAVKGLGPSP